MKKLCFIFVVILCLCSCDRENSIVDKNGVVTGISTEYICDSRICNPKTKYAVKVRVEYEYGRGKTTNYYTLYTDHKYAIGDTIKIR